MKILRRYIGKYKFMSLLSPLFKMFEVVLELCIPLVIADMIDNGIAEGDKKYILVRAVVMAAMAVLGFAFAVIAQYFAARTASGIASDMRKDVFDKIHSLAVKDYEKIGASRLITVTTGDINQIQSGINLTLRLLLRSPCVVLGAIIMAFIIDAGTALIFVLCVAALSLFIALNLSHALPSYSDTRNGLDDIVSAADNGISGVKVIRGFNRTADDYQRYVNKSRKLKELQERSAGISAYLNPVTFFIINISVCVLIYLGYIRVDNGLLTAGEVVALYNYMGQILVELIKLANMAVNLSRALACAGRVGQIISLPSENRKVSSCIEDPHFPHSIEFRNVCFTYDGSSEECLSDISFKCEAGDTIGIIGRTGSGKSTIAKLLAGIYLPDSGKILIDGIDTSSVSRRDLSESIGYSMQKTGLFSGSISDNIRIYRESVTDEQVDRAIIDSCSDDIIKSKDEGKDYLISPGGTGLSGGQKQRIGIARALAGQPGILILDDSTSALDAGTENRLLSNLDDLSGRPTRIVISQKIRTVKDADTILVMDEGRISDSGSHEELLQTSESYRFLDKLQKEAEDV